MADQPLASDRHTTRFWSQLLLLASGLLLTILIIRLMAWRMQPPTVPFHAGDEDVILRRVKL